jgi:hypothetical protein
MVRRQQVVQQAVVKLLNHQKLLNHRKLLSRYQGLRRMVGCSIDRKRNGNDRSELSRYSNATNP